MRIDLGLVLAIIIEYILFVFYADTLFYRKRNKYVCYSTIALGYILHMIGCMFGNIVINIIISVSVHFFCFIIFYYINYINAIFQSMLLSGLCLASEYLIVSMPFLGIVPSDPSLMTPTQSIILTLTSRTLYLICIMILSRVFYKGKQRQVMPSLGLVIIPLLATSVVILMIKTNLTSKYLAISCMVLMVINIIAFLINQKMISKELENAELKEQIAKEQVDFEQYLMLKEKYERINVFHHDFKEHINTLNSLINSDNEQAKKYIQSICKEEETSQFIDYSDNDILNVLLSKKKEECHAQGIEFKIDPIQARLAFIKDTDIVSIFSNLLNNAVESCQRSEAKTIFLNISTRNENFVVIRLENTADEKPVVIDGKLKTHKDNSKLHGIGMNSIRRTLKKYNGYLKWQYDDKEKIFSTTIVVKNVIQPTVHSKI